MFVPIDLLAPILGDLIARAAWPGEGRPWLGVNAQACTGGCLSAASTPGSPAEQAGLKRGDIIAGVNGEKTRTPVGALSQGLGARLRRRHRAARRAVGQHAAPRRLNSVNRLDTLKLQSTF